ncbi:glycoside hydrolase family 15 protein [Halobacteriovorax sp.]|uniref:glycoside hydrolase family 15 protein n=1 Tax=Halobacteriovorax sp. TaxID=2020862 RepID=UPI003569D114
MRILFLLSFILLQISTTQAVNVDSITRRLFANISPDGTTRGVVVASPSRENPNYFYHWIRDAALVMNVVNDLYIREQDPIKKNLLKEMMIDFAVFSKDNQQRFTLSGLGEPKFYVDGRGYDEPWGRPQNDGPALRAITLINFANSLIESGEEELVRSLLYSADFSAQSVIKTDLEYVSHHWREASFDYWEEVIGSHFSTLLAQRRSLLMGADLAIKLNDPLAAKWYNKQALLLENEINLHWDEGRNHIVHSRNTHHHRGGLDIATILGVLHSAGSDNFYNVTNDRVLATSTHLKNSFKNIYKINKDSNLGVAIGRYPEDTYDGVRTDSLGNPWFLATLAYAEYYQKVKKSFLKKGRIEINETNKVFFSELLGNSITSNIKAINIKSKLGKNLVRVLDSQIESIYKRVNYHSSRSGSIAEQMNRDNGYMQGARDLTWSYASYLSALLSK